MLKLLRARYSSRPDKWFAWSSPPRKRLPTLTVDELAAVLKVSPSWVYEHTRTRRRAAGLSNRWGLSLTRSGSSPFSWSHRQTAFSAEPRVARHRLHTAFAQMDDEMLKIGIADQDDRTITLGCALVCDRERFPGGLIPRVSSQRRC